MIIDDLFEALMSNDIAIRNKAIDEAKNTKYISVFFQPVESKAIWESCAIIIASKSDCELERYKYRMFEWLQDMDWPGASVIFDRLLDFPYESIQSEFSYCVRTAIQTNDKPWLDALEDFSKKHSEEMYLIYRTIAFQ